MATAIRKIRVRPARSTFRAISLGVLRRSAPSTMAIMRSRKGRALAAVTRTLIQSETTVVPPVTAERSPPASRITGADSPGDGGLVDRGDALDDLAVGGDQVAGLDHHDLPDLELVGGRGDVGPVLGVDDQLGLGVHPRGAQGVRGRPCRGPWATLSAKLANSTVAHSQPAICTANQGLVPVRKASAAETVREGRHHLGW